MEKYRDRPAPTEGTIVDSNLEPVAAAAAGPNALRGIVRRWYIVLTVFILFAGAGLPAVWFLVQPKYQATAAIRVAPIIQSIIYKDRESEGVMPMYDAYVNTQIELISSEPVLHRVADELANRNLLLFQQKDLITRKTQPVRPLQALKEAIRDQVIRIDTKKRSSELIKIIVQSPSAQEAQLIANTIQRTFMTWYDDNKSDAEERHKTLKDNEGILSRDLQARQDVIYKMSDKYAAKDMTGLYELTLEKVRDLQAQLMQAEATRMAIEIELEILQETWDPNAVPKGLTERRHAFINGDATLQSLTHSIAQEEQRLVMLRLKLAPTNPELNQQEEIIAALKQREEERRAELATLFDENVSLEFTRDQGTRQKELQTKLRHTELQENLLRQKLDQANQELIQVGRDQIEMQKKKDELTLTKEMHDAIKREMKKIEIEQSGRPARITEAYQAYSMEMPNKKMKLSAAVVFAALAGGFFLAFLRAKADHRLRTPDDVIRRIGVPVLGTMVSHSRRDRKRLPELVANDYQTIRANLGLHSGGQIPHRLVVTSPGIREGKTTFAINLATSVARAGGKVLLIDGDLRKPDIAHILQIPDSHGTLADVLLGLCDFSEAVFPLRQQGFDVLSMNGRNAAQALENLGNRQVGQRIHAISQNYDHVIIDTPPVLIAPDALLWARMADAVVICSLAGQTDGPDLAEAFERLSHTQVKILGNVLSNVSSEHNYYRYNYDYHHNGSKAKTNGKAKQKNRLILALQEAEPKQDTPKP